MPDSKPLPTAPLPPVGSAASVQPVRGEKHVAASADPSSAPHEREAAAVTSGSLSAAYAQFIVDPDTHNVVIRIRDATTDRVLNEYPSRQVQEMDRHMKQYAETAARLRASQRDTSAT